MQRFKSLSKRLLVSILYIAATNPFEFFFTKYAPEHLVYGVIVCHPDAFVGILDDLHRLIVEVLVSFYVLWLQRYNFSARLFSFFTYNHHELTINFPLMINYTGNYMGIIC